MSTKLVLRPTAPASRQARSRSAIARSRRRWRRRSWASGPITNMRSTEWPTSGATFNAMLPASASSQPPKPSPQRQSTPASNAASGISSIRRNMRLNAVALIAAQRRQRQRAVARHHGGDAVLDGGERVRVEAQLGVVVRVRVDEPGGDDRPVASITRCASPARPPTATTLPPLDRRRRRGGRAGPSRRRSAVTDDEIEHACCSPCALIVRVPGARCSTVARPARRASRCRRGRARRCTLPRRARWWQCRRCRR
jgi:hypothetical protein